MTEVLVDHSTNVSVEQSNKPLEDQLLYKLGSLESIVSTGISTMNHKLDRLVDALDEQKKSNTRDFEELRERITSLETWKTYSKARIATIVAVATLVWAVWARPIQTLLNGPLLSQ